MPRDLKDQHPGAAAGLAAEPACGSLDPRSPLAFDHRRDGVQPIELSEHHHHSTGGDARDRREAGLDVLGVDAGGGQAGDDTAGRGADEAMTRSEEELRIGTETRERGRVRLRKYVTTEQEQVTVPVQREEVRVEREPITDANIDAATSGPDISEAEHEVTLREEEPVVEKQAVPKERVRLDTDTVTEERQVGEEVRKEQIEVEGDRDRLRDDQQP